MSRLPVIQICFYSILMTFIFGWVDGSVDVTLPPRRDCPRNWTRYERTKSCFWINEQRLKWTEAERYCQKLGGHLASVADEYENIFLFDFGKKANLTVPTVWLGKVIRLAKNGAYDWHDGSAGRYGAGFRGEPPSGSNICLTMWLDLERPEGSWNEWDCNYAAGYSSICKKSFRRSPQQVTVPAVVEGQQNNQTTNRPPQHASKRCCINCQVKCAVHERCIPDDLNCLINPCNGTAPGWCLPIPT